MEYTIVITEGFTDTEKKVNRLIAEGWRPQGGVFIVREPNPYDRHQTDTEYYQAMIREKVTTGRAPEQSPEPKITIDWRATEQNISREFSVMADPDPVLAFARHVSTIMKLHDFSLDDAMMVVNMAKDGE